jgi:hypothetical protein
LVGRWLANFGLHWVSFFAKNVRLETVAVVCFQQFTVISNCRAVDYKCCGWHDWWVVRQAAIGVAERRVKPRLAEKVGGGYRLRCCEAACPARFVRIIHLLIPASR